MASLGRATFFSAQTILKESNELNLENIDEVLLSKNIYCAFRPLFFYDALWMMDKKKYKKQQQLYYFFLMLSTLSPKSTAD
jgi:hypothetical protein